MADDAGVTRCRRDPIQKIEAVRPSEGCPMHDASNAEAIYHKFLLEVLSKEKLHTGYISLKCLTSC